MIILVGPQGSGKTTQAYIIKKILEVRYKGAKVCLTEAIHYTLIARLWYRLIMIITRRIIRYKFYSNTNTVQEFIEPTLLKKLFILDLLIHITSAVISSLKLKILFAFCNVIIEHEGFIFNQIAYIAFIHRRHASPLNIVRKLRILFALLPKKTIIVQLLADPTHLKERQAKRGSPIEPLHYMEFQLSIYDKMLVHPKVNVIRIDANKDIDYIYRTLRDNFNLIPEYKIY